MDISELRNGIDAIDSQLTSLFLQRMKLSASIAAYKKQMGLPIHVPQREQQIIETLTQNTSDTLSPYVARLYEEIFALSREYQKQLTEG